MVSLEQFTINDNCLLFTLSRKGLQLMMNGKAERPLREATEIIEGNLRLHQLCGFLR
jgi:hypothetical protein